MQIPGRIKVGAIWYTIRQVGQSQIDTESCATMGDCDYQTQTIRIAEGVSQEMKEVTLFHEILHAVDCQLDHDLVELLAQSLYQVFKENKMLR